MIGNYIRTPEHSKKISEALKGHPMYKLKSRSKKLSSSLKGNTNKKGKKLSKESIKRIKASLMNMPESKKIARKMKMRLARLGIKQSEETIKKRVESRKWYKHSKETRGKIAKSNYKKNAPTHNKSEYEKNRQRNKLEKIAGRKRPEQCEICGAIGKICFDHDHNTGKFRGWICTRCNLVLGLVKDNAELLDAINKYISNKGGV